MLLGRKEIIMRLIDISPLIEARDKCEDMECRDCELEVRDCEYMMVLLMKMPTIDAVPVIRCKDCKHRYIKNDVWTCPFGLPSGPDGYCSYAERKES